MKGKKLGKQFVRLKSMTLAEGLLYLHAPNQERKINGFWIEDKTKRTATRLHMFKSGQISCVKCGISGDHFHIERHKNDNVMPFSINLYATVNCTEILMTLDHILPKSKGGSNHTSNAQCMCVKCNNKKGDNLTLSEILYIASDKHAHLMHKFEQITGTIFTVISDVSKSSKCDQSLKSLGSSYV